MELSPQPSGGPSREHFAALDGLRGIAALSVLLFHLGHWLGQPHFAANSGLAVDFFFCLSGYVVSTAYNDKINLGLLKFTFIKIRLIRLMPLIAFGTMISASYIFTRILLLHEPINITDVTAASLLGILCVPYFEAGKSIGGPQVFPLNGPQYTLFLEIIINLFWAVIGPRNQILAVIGLAVLGFAATSIVGLGGDTVATFWSGFPRVVGSYYAGVGLFLLGRKFPLEAWPYWRFLFWPLAMCMLILFYFPHPLPLTLVIAWVSFGSPILVLAGARVRLKGLTHRLALILGVLSYPIYALHYPIFVWVNAIFQELTHHKSFAIEAVLTTAAVILGAWLGAKFVDEPVRAWLGRRTGRTLVMANRFN